MSLLPLLAITLGDPAGIGPEIIVKALRRPEVFTHCRPLVIGDARILGRAASWLGAGDLAFDPVEQPGAGRFAPGWISLLDLGNADPAQVAPGKLSAAGGRAAVECVFCACDLALAGAVDAVVTAPLNKEAIHLAGFSQYAGHTELLAERTGAGRVSMLLTGPRLRVVHVSTHVSLAEAIRRVTAERVGQVIELAQRSCLALGVAQPRIAVAGLNPHASENGLFGDEEAREIWPAVRAARARGLNVSEPLPPDTVFLRAFKGEFDIVVAMYHDQGHIPVKLLGFNVDPKTGKWDSLSGVNVTLGLPIIRTSVDHGTAFDIAGKGIANELSLLEAVDYALRLAATRVTGLKGAAKP